MVGITSTHRLVLSLVATAAAAAIHAGCGSDSDSLFRGPNADGGQNTTPPLGGGDAAAMARLASALDSLETLLHR